MLSLTTSISAVIVSVLMAIGVLWIIQWAWDPGRRRSHNDVIGPSVGVIGTTYAVIVAFILSGVWSNFQAALRNSEYEANSLVSLRSARKGAPRPLNVKRVCASNKGICERHDSFRSGRRWRANSYRLTATKS